MQNSPINCQQNFVRYVVNARREGDENPKTSVLAETIMLIVNSSYGYHNMDRIRHTVIMYLYVEKTHGAIKNKRFNCPDFLIDQIYEVELVKSEIQYEKSKIVEFFIVQDANLRRPELYFYFYDKYCDFTKFEVLDTDIY